MRRFLDRLYTAAGALGAVFVALICVLMIAQSILREVGVRTGALNDVVAWFCAAAAFFATITGSPPARYVDSLCGLFSRAYTPYKPVSPSRLSPSQTMPNAPEIVSGSFSGAISP